MGGAPGVADRQRAEREGTEVGDLDRAGVDHHRRVHPVEGPRLQQQRLARPAFLGRCADHPYGEPELLGVRGEPECCAEAGGGDQVVPAGVPEAGQRVVLADECDGDRPAAERRAERGGQAVRGCGDGVAVGAQQFGAPGGRAVLLEGGLGVGVDAAAEREQLCPVRVHAVADGLLGRGQSRGQGRGQGHEWRLRASGSASGPGLPEAVDQII